eukprot:COSAG06_NODE_3741_length_4955_cov_47.397309_4_plen_58_part_00
MYCMAALIIGGDEKGCCSNHSGGISKKRSLLAPQKSKVCEHAVHGLWLFSVGLAESF